MIVQGTVYSSLKVTSSKCVHALVIVSTGMLHEHTWSLHVHWLDCISAELSLSVSWI
jgi:hypothetical protein